MGVVHIVKHMKVNVWNQMHVRTIMSDICEV